MVKHDLTVLFVRLKARLRDAGNIVFHGGYDLVAGISTNARQIEPRGQLDGDAGEIGMVNYTIKCNS